MRRKPFLILLVIWWVVPGVPGAWSESPQDLQLAIEALSDPRDHERSSRVLDAISQAQDEGIRQALMEQFDRRMGALLAGAPIETGAMSNAPQPWAAGGGRGLQSAEETALRMELEELNLGSGATVEDIRRRDALVARIAPLADPTLRYELLDRLAQREQEAEGDFIEP